MASLHDLIEEASDKFRKTFHQNASVVGHGSGRVNLIGEHTDYNDGLVLPMALPLQTVMVGGLSSESVCNIQTMSPVKGSSEAIFCLNELTPSARGDEEPSWANYIQRSHRQLSCKRKVKTIQLYREYISASRIWTVILSCSRGGNILLP